MERSHFKWIEDGQEGIIVPVINNELSIMTFVVPKTFRHKMEMQAALMIDSFEKHPSVGVMAEDNKLMQALSFVLQNAFEFYLDNTDDYFDTPEIDE